jgi:prepilin-type N-terminal cleavage/methylation domain-containing protein/prepilin-type processing-associated H-X9-DG protein
VKKRAFTLIELLVVIAIIAILAAILFPVFAQAKLAAKRASSLSNVKQLTLSEIIYQNDYDDNFVLSANDLCNGGCPSTDPYICVSNLSTPAPSWPLILQPYVKSLALLVDPGTGDSAGIYSQPGIPGTVNNTNPTVAYTLANQNAAAQYGYNYEFLSPLVFTAPTLLANDTLCCGNSTESGLGRSVTQAVSPSATVMFATTQGFASNKSAAFAFQTPDGSFANAAGTDFALLPSADRVVIVGNTCFGGAPSTAAVTVDFGYCGWAGADPVGVLTADVRTVSPYQGANIGWVDGHAKYATAGALAAGTDYGTAVASSHPISGFNTGSIPNGLIASGNKNTKGATNALGLAAPTGYVWSLDGTLSDIN